MLKTKRAIEHKLAIGYVPQATPDGTTYYATENGGASTTCRRHAATLANPFSPAARGGK